MTRPNNHIHLTGLHPPMPRRRSSTLHELVALVMIALPVVAVVALAVVLARLRWGL